MWYTDLCQNHLTEKRRKTKVKELEVSGRKNEFEWKYTGTTSYREYFFNNLRGLPQHSLSVQIFPISVLEER